MKSHEIQSSIRILAVQDRRLGSFRLSHRGTQVIGRSRVARLMPLMNQVRFLMVDDEHLMVAVTKRMEKPSGKLP